jgi:hypothetical protein
MKIVKFAYMNDEQRKVGIRILDLHYDYATATGDTYTFLDSCEFRVFELQIPDDAIVYVKRWPSGLLISYFVETSHQQSDSPVESTQCGVPS